jgi:electron transport complex protein RnfG
MIIVLTVTAILSGGVLSIFNLFTAPRIAAYEQSVLENSIGFVMPGITTYEEKTIDGVTFYIGKDENNKVISVAFKAEGNGFQSIISMLVGMNTKMDTILALRILNQKETPGLGTKIENDPSSKENSKWFTDQFQKLPFAGEITYVKNQKPSKPSEIQAITGATISSKSVVEILNTTINRNREILSPYLESLEKARVKNG